MRQAIKNATGQVNRQRAAGKSAGFTIVETLIVLAVTGFLFLGAVIIIGGRLNATSYSQSVRSVQTNLQQTINEVGSGYYLNDGSFKCSAGALGPVFSTSATNSQGTNDACIFLGKVMQFRVGTATPETYNTYTLVGLRLAANKSNSSNFVDSRARLVTKVQASEPVLDNAVDIEKLLYGIKVYRVYYDNEPNNPAKQVNAIGFSSNQSSLASAGSNDGAQQVNTFALLGTTPGASQAVGAAQINTSLGLPTQTIVNPAGGIQICLDGDNGKSAVVSIGGNSRQGSVDIRNFSVKNCGII